MSAFLLLILLVAILAYFEARREKRMIDARPGGPDLDHKELIWRRLRNVGALVMVAVVFDGTEGWDALWMGLCHAGAAWATFTIVHRFTMNAARKMDWRFVANSSWFDRQCLRVVGIDTATKTFNLAYHSSNAFGREVFRKWVHRAGTLAYCFELTVLAASIVGAIAILTNT